MNPSPKKKDSPKAAASSKSHGLTSEELEAMKETLKERKAAARLGKEKEDGESDLLAKIAEMAEPDRSMATRLHALIKASVPALTPKTWYGMPAYAKDGKIVCFFQSSQKFKTRYSTFGFNEAAHLDEGSMWPVAYALTKLTAVEETRIIALVKKSAR